MDGNSLHRIRDALIARRRQLRYGDQIDDISSTSEAAGQVDIIDIAQTLEQIDRDKSLKEQERRELNAIERALAKIAVGTFGICEECGDEILEKRLQVLPEARLCARCQASEERQLGRYRVASGR
jgi:DnaK suppressor protein